MKDPKTLLRVSIIGTTLVALCCFTPVLVILLGVVGLSALTGYLDYVLLPAHEPYAGGCYHGKITFPEQYPFKPPSIRMLTPSGRFQVNTRLCLSMSDFHPETWQPSW